MIAIVKYNAGNSRSVQNSLNKLGCESIVTSDPNIIQSADKVVFPGVGQAASAMHYLKERKLDTTIKSLTQPVLGICLGLQLMCASSMEGNTEGLGIFDAKVRLFPPTDKTPHMGWNSFKTLEGKLFAQVNATDDVYYVHGFYAELCKNTIATCEYIETFSAALQKDNYYATQFHPEKSSLIGERILANFLEL